MKNKKLFNNKKTIIIINLLLILALMTGSVYSWFAVNVENRVDVYEIEVEADNALELSFTGEANTWSNSLNLSDLKNSDGESVLTKLNFGEITGDGTNFQVPTLSQYGNYALVDKTAEWSGANENVDYLKFTVHLRSQDPLYVFLSSDSAATPATDKYTGAGTERPAACSFATDEEKFSKDCIVGALRVGFDDVDGKDGNLNKLNNIWITNPKLHLTNTIGTDDYSMDFNAVSADYQDGPYDEMPPNPTDIFDKNYKWNNPYTHYYYDSSKTLKNTVADVEVITELPDTVINPYNTDYSPKGILLAKLVDGNCTYSEGYYTDTVEFTIWLEGCDTEARRALVGGKFKLSLAFDSIAPPPVSGG